MGRLFAIAIKDLRLLSRDRAALVWVAAFPIFMAVVFGAMFGGGSSGGGKMEVAIVDLDGSARSKAIVADLDKSGSVRTQTLAIETAKQKVRKGEIAAYVQIDKGVGEASMMAPPEKPLLEIGADPKRQMESGLLEGLLSRAWFEELGKDMPMASAMLKQGSGVTHVPVEQSGITPGNAFDISFPQAMLWALIGVANTFAISLVKERTGGTLQRLLMAPISRSQVLFGKGLACFLMAAIVLFFLSLLGSLAFRLQALQHLPQLVLAVACAGICYAGLMMFISTLGKTEHSAAGAGWGIMMLFSMFGGGMVPLFVMPAWMQSVGSFSPAKWAILSLEGAIWRGFSLAEMLLPCGILVAVGAVAFGAGSAMMRKMTAS